jgi:nicotinamide phosphoribosyltransferase
MTNNILLLTDSYKASHWKQYPKNTTKVFSYLESRGSDEKNMTHTLFFGLQYLLMKYLVGKPVTLKAIKEAKEYYDAHVGPGVFHEEGWMYIHATHSGRLPVSIKAVPEGTILPTKNVLVTVENTDPNCYWLTNYLETLLSQLWYSCTTATISYTMKNVLLNALDKSGDPSLVGFKLHDFGCRGVSSMETAAIGGAAHLVNFMGTDTVPALHLLREYYGEKMAGFSIPAAEHSTITSWGKENEVEAYRNMLEQYPSGLVAVVSDSYDIYSAVKNMWGGALRDKVMEREGTLVVRPDSGDPKKVVPDLLDLLSQRFDYHINNKGYKVLTDKVRLIQGDGIDRNSLSGILEAIMDRGWSADNVAFGSGGGLLQQCNRDTLKFAFKCSSATIDGQERDVSKQPTTASWKKSKAGRLKLVHNDGFRSVHGSPWATVNEPHAVFDVLPNQLVEVFRDGNMMVKYSLEQIRKRSNEGR